MSQIRIRKLETYTEKDLNDIATIFTVAFEGDPVALAMLGVDESLIYPLERATVACVAKSGELWVASYGDRAFVSEWPETFLPQFEAVTDEVLGEGVKRAAWNLMTIGLPDVRRRGLASALVRAVIEKAQANNELVTVETGREDNLEFYESQGWKTLNRENPAHLDDIDGNPMQVWVISSVRGEQF